MDALVHTTDRQTFKKCRALWDFSSNLRRNLAPIYTSRNYRFGTAWHAGLAAYYDPDSPRDITLAFDALTASLLKELESIANPDPEIEAEFEEDRVLGIGMLNHYASYANLYDDFIVMQVENAYVIPLGDGVSYSFQPDLLVQDPTGRYWIVEHKTSSKLPSNTDYLLMDDQCGSYIWGLELASGIKAEGVLYNIALKAVPTPMKMKLDGHLSTDKRIRTTYDAAVAQINIHYHDREIPWGRYREFLDVKRALGNPFFYRENVRRNRREIEILGESIRAEIADMTNPDLPIYRNPSAFNCSGCSFLAPCLARFEGSDFDVMLKGNYKARVK